jgi:hypothetical protein
MVSSFLRKKRAQAAIELLTTYGWAIIGVLLVIGALAYFNVFDAKRFVAERCDTGPQIQCQGAYLGVYSNTEYNPEYFEMEIKNNYLVDIDIDSVSIPLSTGEIELMNVEEGVPYATLHPGNLSRFYIASNNIGTLHKGDKNELPVKIIFRRHTPTNTPGGCGTANQATCYNITGDLVIKVQNAETVPPPHDN